MHPVPNNMVETLRVAHDNKMDVADILERVFLFLLLGWFLCQLIPSFRAEPYNLLVVISEVFTVLLVLIRKPGAMATTFYAWTIAIVGTCMSLLVVPTGAAVVPAWSGGLIMFGGLAVSVGAKIFLNRSFGIVAANRGVKRHGPYRFIRHPMYLGYILTHIGFLLLHISMWNILIYAAAWTALVLRIRAEENFLFQDSKYRDYVKAVPSRLIPGVY